jgi:HEAT repeat protein
MSTTTGRIVIFRAVLGVLAALLASATLAAQPSVAELSDELNSPDEAQQLHAIGRLAALGPRAAAAVRPLSDLLTNPSAEVRARAAHALGEIGPAAGPAVTALATAATDTDPGVRRQAIGALAHVDPDPKMLVPLSIQLLKDPDPGVRLRVLQAIASAGPKAVPGLIDGLKDPKTAYWASILLREIGPPAKDAVPALVARLRDRRPEVRREAILALGSTGEAARPAVRQIAAALGDAEMRTAATYALARIGDVPADAEAAIRDNIRSRDTMLSTTSLWALAKLHPEDQQFRRDATERLIARLKDRDDFVRAAASRALAELPPAPEVTAPIWDKALRDADETTVRYALDALVQLGPGGVPALVDALRFKKLRIYVVPTLGRIGPDAAAATPALAALIFDKDDRVSHEAVLALARIGPRAKEAVPLLIEAIEHGDFSDDPSLAYALGKIGPDAAVAVPFLCDLMKNRDQHVAVASAWAIVQISGPSSDVAAKTLPVLTTGLSSNRSEIRQGAAEALGRLGRLARKTIPALQKAADDSDEAVRQTATMAIRSIRGELAKRE